jgi:nicotinamidase-related amidase
MVDRNTMEKRGNVFIKGAYEIFENPPTIDFEEIKQKDTVLMIMDMVNGFVKNGALMDQRINSLIPGVTALAKKFKVNGMEILAFADSHQQKSTEFESFIQHCLEGTAESEIIDELKEVGGYKLIKKNSTNGMYAPAFQEWLKDNFHKRTYVLIGDCTDICVLQLALSIRAYYDQHNTEVEIMVVKELVDTYDLGLHDADVMNLFSFYVMHNSGIRIVRNINLD